MSDLVTIVTPSYKSEKYLARTIESVLAQKYLSWELVIVDDCSPDNANELVEKYIKNDRRIKLLRLDKNSGAAVARNAAIEAANGRYIAFLDSDDQWLPDKLARQIGFMQSKDIAFSYTAYEKLNEEGAVIGAVRIPAKVSYAEMLKVSSIGCLTAMYDTHKLGKIYMPLIRKRQDLGLWLRILRKVSYAYGLNEVLAQYQVRKDSISANKLDAAKYTWRLYREIEGMNFAVAGYYFAHYAVNGVLRTRMPRMAKALGKI